MMECCRTFLRPNPHQQLTHFILTLILFVTAILPVSHITVKANPPPQNQPGQSHQGAASPGADITAGFLQLHPNGYPGNVKDVRRGNDEAEEEEEEPEDQDYSSLAAILMVRFPLLFFCHDISLDLY